MEISSKLISEIRITMHEPLLQTPQERGAGAKDCMVRCSESMAGATGCWGPDELIRLGPCKVARQIFDMYAFPHLRAFTSKIMNLTGSSEGQGGVRRPTHLAQPAKLDCVKEVGPTAYKRTPCGGGSLPPEPCYTALPEVPAGDEPYK